MAETLYQLRYRVRLENAAVFATINGDPNIVRSEGYVPGSAVWGALAAAYIRQELKGNGDAAHTDPNFRQWFLQEGLRCLNAYPAIPNGSNKFVRTLPMPLSFRHEKGDEKHIENFYDFACEQDEKDEEVRAAKERAGSKFYLLNGSKVVPYSSRTRWMYHTTRKNRKQGRADEDSGAVFVYEALDGGQTFEGRILGNSDVLNGVVGLLRDDNAIWLGRSKATQYGGGGKLTFVDSEPQPYSREVEAETRDTTQIVVTLTSHLLARTDETGYISAQFPTDELARALNPDTPPQLCLIRSFARRETVGGYVAKWGLPRPQWSAFTAGSVFVFEVQDATISADAITQAEAYGIGLRVGEGYGRFVINAHGRKAMLKRTDSDKTKLELDSASPKFTQIITQIAQDDIRQKVRAAAQKVAGAFSEDVAKIPSPALLGRLTLIVQRTDMKELGEVILAAEGDPRYSRTASLKDIARRQLERCRRTKDGSVEALIDHVRDVAAEKVLTGDILKGYLGKEANDVALKVGYDVEKDMLFRADLAKTYLLTLLAALSRTARMRGDEIDPQ